MNWGIFSKNAFPIHPPPLFYGFRQSFSLHVLCITNDNVQDKRKVCLIAKFSFWLRIEPVLTRDLRKHFFICFEFWGFVFLHSFFWKSFRTLFSLIEIGMKSAHFVTSLACLTCSQGMDPCCLTLRLRIHCRWLCKYETWGKSLLIFFLEKEAPKRKPKHDVISILFSFDFYSFLFQKQNSELLFNNSALVKT